MKNIQLLYCFAKDCKLKLYMEMFLKDVSQFQL